MEFIERLARLAADNPGGTLAALLVCAVVWLARDNVRLRQQYVATATQSAALSAQALDTLKDLEPLVEEMLVLVQTKGSARAKRRAGVNVVAPGSPNAFDQPEATDSAAGGKAADEPARNRSPGA